MKTLASITLCVAFLLFLLPCGIFCLPADSYNSARDSLQTTEGKSSKIQNEFQIQFFLRSLIMQTQKKDDLSLQKATKAGSFWDLVLAILHLFGISNEEILLVLEIIVTGIENILAKLSPEDVMAVEYAAGDILGMINSGYIDLERLQSDLSIIYTIMWPHVNPEYKPIIIAFFEFLVLLWNFVSGRMPPEFLVPSHPTSNIGALLSNIARN